MQHFTKINVWQRSRALAIEIYHQTKGFPDNERYGLTSQLRRAAVSVPTNIAEGSKRQTSADYARFLNMAEGSAAEVESHIILARDLGYLTPEVADPILAEIQEINRMLHALRTKVEQAA